MKDNDAAKDDWWNPFWGSPKIERYAKKNNSYNDVNDILRKLTAMDSNCIEIGCGSGTYAVELNAMGRKCLATDITDEALKLTKLKGKCLYNIDVPRMKVDLYNMPFKDDTFDLIFSDGVIEHLDIEKALDAMCQKLKPGGWLVTKVPSGNYFYKFVYYVLSRIKNRPFEEWHTPEEWIGFAKKAKLRNILLEKCGGILVGMYKRLFGKTKLTKYIPNIGRIHYIFYGQK
jgi:SAM-dependent methyltransferase